MSLPLRHLLQLQISVMAERRVGGRLKEYRETSKQTAWYYSWASPRDVAAHHSSLQRERCVQGEVGLWVVMGGVGGAAGFLRLCNDSGGVFEDSTGEMGRLERMGERT